MNANDTRAPFPAFSSHGGGNCRNEAVRAAFTRRVILRNEGSRPIDAYVRGENEILRKLRMTSALQRAVISSRFPATTFSVYEWDDPEGIFLSAVVDTEDLEEVTDLFSSRMVDLQVDEGLPLFVIPERTPERTAAILKREAQESLPFLLT